MRHTEYLADNPGAVIVNGDRLEHTMEYDEPTGFERCQECGQEEVDMDDVCPASPDAMDGDTEWEDYVTPGPASEPSTPALTLNLAPSWETAARIYAAVLEHGNATAEGKRVALAGLLEMGRIIDEIARTTPDRSALAQVMREARTTVEANPDGGQL